MFRQLRIPAACCFCFTVKKTKEEKETEMSTRFTHPPVSFERHDSPLDNRIGYLPEDALDILCCELSVHSELGRDWRKIASYIRLPSMYVNLICSRKDGRLEARVLFDLWDEGIEKNPGSVRKLLVALSQCDFGGSLKALLKRLQGNFSMN